MKQLIPFSFEELRYIVSSDSPIEEIVEKTKRSKGSVMSIRYAWAAYSRTKKHQAGISRNTYDLFQRIDEEGSANDVSNTPEYHPVELIPEEREEQEKPKQTSLDTSSLEDIANTFLMEVSNWIIKQNTDLIKQRDHLLEKVRSLEEVNTTLNQDNKELLDVQNQLRSSNWLDSLKKGLVK